MADTGDASTSRITRPASAAGNGRRWISRLHRYQKPSRTCTFLPTIGTWNLSMLCPTKPSTAGSSVSEIAIVSATARIAPVARPADELDADQVHAGERDDHRAAGEEHGLARGRDRLHHRRFRSQAVLQALPVARDDEQRVVDADAEADHRRELRRELGHRQHVGEQADAREGDADAEQRVQDRQAHRQQRAEDDEQDHDGRAEADRLCKAELRLPHEVAGQLDLQRRVVLRGHGLHAVERALRQVVVFAVPGELDLGERDARIDRRDLQRPPSSYGERIALDPRTAFSRVSTSVMAVFDAGIGDRRRP